VALAHQWLPKWCPRHNLRLTTAHQRGRSQTVTDRQPPEPAGREYRLKAMMDVANPQQPGPASAVRCTCALSWPTSRPGLVIGSLPGYLGRSWPTPG
jgi:hypothetical protein